MPKSPASRVWHKWAFHSGSDECLPMAVEVRLAGGNVKMPKAPASRVLPINVAHSARETSPKVQKSSRFKAFVRLRLTHLSRFD
jgi:hypothetical protein